jgi:hypothetical protein
VGASRKGFAFSFFCGRGLIVSRRAFSTKGPDQFGNDSGHSHGSFKGGYTGRQGAHRLAATATCAATTSVADGGANASIGSGQVALLNNRTGVPLTADQEFEAGLTCDGKPAAPSPTGPALAFCDAAGFGSTLVKIPAPGKENDDHNPQRIQPRSLFDASIGDDNLFNGDHHKWSLRLTVINLTNKDVLYNFLSTFSGTHYVTPRTETVELGFHF